MQSHSNRQSTGWSFGNYTVALTDGFGGTDFASGKMLTDGIPVYNETVDNNVFPNPTHGLFLVAGEIQTELSATIYNFSIDCAPIRDDSGGLTWMCGKETILVPTPGQTE